MADSQSSISAVVSLNALSIGITSASKPGVPSTFVRLAKPQIIRLKNLQDIEDCSFDCSRTTAIYEGEPVMIEKKPET